MYKIANTNRYKKDLKRISSNSELVNEINAVVRLLSESDTPLPKKYNDHSLKGNYAAFRECHVRPDWLLVYQKTKKELTLMLVRTGSHSHIF